MIYISTACIKNDNIIDTINQLSTITKNIELSGGSKPQPNLLENLLFIKNEKSLNFILHCYFPPPSQNFILNFADISSITRDFVSESMRYIDALDISYYSIHTGYAKYISPQYLPIGDVEYNQKNIYKNIDWFYANFPNKKLAIENIFPIEFDLDSSYGGDINQLVEFLENDKRVYLLLDLGHLKVASRSYKFDYLKAVELLFEKYADRILELHISENDGILDEHLLIYSDSIQYMIVSKYKDIIKKNNINITLETRNYPLDELKECYELFHNIF